MCLLDGLSSDMHRNQTATLYNTVLHSVRRVRQAEGTRGAVLWLTTTMDHKMCTGAYWYWTVVVVFHEPHTYTTIVVLLHHPHSRYPTP